MKAFLLLSLFIIIFQNANAKTEMTFDIDTDGNPDRITIDYENNILISKIRLTSTKNSEQVYKIPPFDACNEVSLYKGKNAGEIVIDGSCPGRQSQIYIQTYIWDKNRKAWIMTRNITGERPDPSVEIFTPILHVSRINCCVSLGERFSIQQEKTVKNADEEIEKELEIIKQKLLLENERGVALTKIDIYTATEYASHLSNENVRLLNDIAFYMQSLGSDLEAAIILEKVVEKYPDRFVAMLNLADSYWSIGYKSQAITFYRKYFNEMSKRNLEKKTPPRVFLRANSKD